MRTSERVRSVIVYGAVATLVAFLATWLTPGSAQGSGPGGAYGFSEGTGSSVADLSGNGNAGTLMGGAAWTNAGRFGSALTLSGASSGVEVPATPLLSLTNAFTVEAWVNPSSPSTAQQLLVQTAGPNADGLRLTGNGRPRFTAAFPGGQNDVTGPSALPIGRWTHVAVTYDGAALRMYIDGAQVATKAVSGALSGTGTTWFGRARNGSNAFAGMLDEVRIYTRALSASEIALDCYTPVDTTTPFQVSGTLPTDGTSGVITAPIQAIFSRTITAATVTTTSFVLLDAAQSPVAATVVYDQVTRTATLTPSAPLSALTTYTAAVLGGAGGVIDESGNAMDNDATWSFTTAASTTIPSAAYAFSEGAGAVTADASGNEHTGSLVGGVAWTTMGRYGSALAFDGVDDGVQLPVSDAFKFSTALTIEAWVHPTVATGNARHIVQLQGEAGDGLKLAGNGRPRFTVILPGGATDVTGPQSLPLNVWTHVAVSYDGAMLRLYVNGAQVATKAATGALSGTQPMWIGRQRDGGAPFVGILDEVRIYRRVLDASAISLDQFTPVDATNAFVVSGQTPAPGALGVVATTITATFSRPIDPVTLTTSTFVLEDAAQTPVSASVSYDPPTRTATLLPDLPLALQSNYVARVAGGSNGITDTIGSALAGDVQWSFTTAANDLSPSAAYALDEGSGVEALDSSGNNLTGALVAGTAWTSPGQFGGALSLDGVDDGVELPASDALTFPNGFTIEAWVQPTLATGNARLIVQTPGAGGEGLRLTGDGRARFRATFPSGIQQVTSPTPLPLDEWTHVAASDDGSTLRLYVDGSEVAALAVTGAMPGSGAMWLGRTRLGATPFIGSIDEVRIYRRALTPEEVAADMTTSIGSTGPEPVSIVVAPRGASIATGTTYQFTVTATYGDNTTSDVTTSATWGSGNSAVATVEAGLATAVGPGLATLTATLGPLTASAQIQVADGTPLPPDPSWVALPIDPTVSTSIANSTRFLYTGSDPIQRDVQPGAIDSGRAAVVRGQVTSRDDTPLAGVTIAIADHPEYGNTVSRADGMFDLVVNGGASVTVEYQKAGYLPASRRIDAPRGDYLVVDTVALVPLDTQVTTITATLGAPIQKAQGSLVTDEDGTRQATIIFPAGTTASMSMPDGTSQSLTTLQVRATEFTVGPDGLAAMPAALPQASGYTYAVELSVDEAMAAGATSVNFSAPLPVYVQNFLGFPVGLAVPSGYYDRVLDTWVPAPNGVVMKVLPADTLGRAEVDITGDDQPEDAVTLAAIGMTDAERTVLASTFSSAQTLWRVQVTHFTPWDLNWPYVPPAGYRSAGEVDIAQPRVEQNSSTTCEILGSIVECQDQVLGERVPVAGTPFTLNYRSDRVPGRQSTRLTRIPITETTSPQSLKRVERIVSIAGRVFKDTFPPTGGQETEFVWDGLDVLGRKLEGFQDAQILISHVYDAVYSGPPFVLAAPPAFGQPSPMLTPVPMRREHRETIRRTVRLGNPPHLASSLAGWSLDSHHVYDTLNRTLFHGDGSRRVVGTLDGLRTIVDAPALTLAVDSTGAVYYPQLKTQPDTYAIRKVAANGHASTIATMVGYPSSLIVDDDGSFYYPRHNVDPVTCLDDDTETVSIWRHEASGAEEEVAAVVLPSEARCDGTAAIVTRAPDTGIIYLVANRYVYRLSNSVLQLIAQHPEGAVTAAAGLDGELFVGFNINGGDPVDRMAPGGQFERFAGTGAVGFAGDGGPAITAVLGIISKLAVAPNGSVVTLEENPAGMVRRLRQIGNDGIITTVAGGASASGAGEGDAPSSLLGMLALAFGPDGRLYVSDGNRIFEMPAEFKADPIVARRVVAEDGGTLFEFDEAGRHIRTRHTLTGAVLFTFTYDVKGHLTEITDGDGLVTQIERDGDGAPTAIVAPFGQRTVLTVDAEGWLASIVGPGGQTTTLTSTSSGLLTRLVDGNGRQHDFTYASGRLTKDQDPAGGSQTLARAELADGWQTTRTTELARVRTYKTRVSADETQELTVTEADGTESVTTRRLDGAIDALAADGTRTVTTMADDPRFGAQAPIPASVSVTTPGGLTLTSTTTRTATLSHSSDVASLKTQSETTTINGRSYQTVFNASTRTFTSTTPAGRTSTSTIDTQGRVTRTQVGSLTPVDFIYDGEGRLTTITQGARQSTIAYDGSSRPSTLTDALTRSVTFGYDAADRVTSQTLPDTRQIAFGYDDNGNVTSLTPPGRPAHTFTYTPIDLTSSYVPPTVPGTGPTLYSFNLDRQPTTIVRPDGLSTGFGYDSGGRLRRVTFSRGDLEYAYDAAGRVSTLTDPGGMALAFTYDGALPLSETWSGPITGLVTRTFSNDFDVATENVNAASEIAFGYDADRLLNQVGALTIARDTATGLVIGTTLGTTTDVFQYNAFGEPTHQTAQVNGTNVFDVQIARDDLGRITQRIETVDGITRVFDYGYDLAGRLWQVGRNGTLVARYLYDANGNRVEVQGELGPVSATYDAQDRLLTYNGASYTYAANGELATKTVGGATTGYTYDTLGNLMQVSKPNGDVITYTVDGRGRRVGKSINGILVKGWLYADQLRPIAELDGNNQLVSRFVYGSKTNVPEYIIKSGETYRIFSDHLGTPRVIVHATTGVVVQRLDVRPFGEIIQDSNPGWQPFGFAGGLYDPDTGLIRFGARDYDPSIGRWTAKDPLGIAGDLSSYSYVGADPSNLTDRNGLFSVDVFIKDVVDASGGFGDALLFGFGDELRDAAGLGGIVNQCSGAYLVGEIASVAAGWSRAAYAGAAKGIRFLELAGAGERTARLAVTTRNVLKRAARVGTFWNYRIYTYEAMLAKYGTNTEVIKAAARTNAGINKAGVQLGLIVGASAVTNEVTR